MRLRQNLSYYLKREAPTGANKDSYGGTVMAISRWQPSRPLLSVRDAMDQLFDESVWWPSRPMQNGFYAPMDVYADENGYVVEVSLPGVNPDDIDIQMVSHTLTISGEARLEAPEGRRYLTRQRQGGRFQTSVTLPDAADAAKIKATCEHGVLRLEVPKSETAKPRRIALQTGK
jgi:HSP20 family protein